MTIRFDQFEIDQDSFELRHKGVVVRIEPLVYNLLVFFANAPGRVITQQELLAGVWSGKVVSDTTISSAVKLARKALGDSGATQKYIQTVRSRGFRFVGNIENTVTQNDIPESTAGKIISSSDDSLPSIAVNTFKNLCNDPNEDYFSEGITRDIIVALTQFRTFKVISWGINGEQRNSATSANYVLDGGIRRAGEKVRISVHLQDSKTEQTVWAEKFDRQMEDIFAVQDEVSRAVSATIDGRLNDHRVRDISHASAKDLNVYDIVLRAQELHYRMTKSANNEARKLLLSALDIAPDNHRLHSLFGVVEQINYQLCWTQDLNGSLMRASQHGREAIRLEPGYSLSHARLGDTLLLCERYAESKRYFEKALELNPNDSETLALYSEYLRGTGNPTKALEVLEAVRFYDPYDRLWFPWLQGEALFQLERFDEAILAFNDVLESINDMKITHAACYAALGNSDQARALLVDYLKTAAVEMPKFPGYRYSQWCKFRHKLIESPDPVYSRRMEALKNCWLSLSAKDFH